VKTDLNEEISYDNKFVFIFYFFKKIVCRMFMTFTE
jgi:hypothetical protein